VTRRRGGEGREGGKRRRKRGQQGMLFQKRKDQRVR
jgi:hypothetical protein